MWRKTKDVVTRKSGNIGVEVEDTRTGKRRVLLNTHGKGAKYAKELKDGHQYTNAGRIKTDKHGEVKGLTKTQKAYRAGYLDSNKDHANAFKAKNKRRKK